MLESITFRTNRPSEVVAPWAYLDFIKPFEAAITNCRDKLGNPPIAYRAAIRLCAAGRDLMIRYFNDWQTNTGVIKDIGEIHGLFQAASAVLLDAEGCVPSNKSAHLKRMKENTEMRLRVCDVLRSTLPNEEKYRQSIELYKSIDAASSKGFDIDLF